MANQLEIVARLVLAFLIGALIGWDRETRGKPAGFRTLTMVSLASALYVTAARGAAAAVGEPADMARAMAGIAQGVGFLGAGAILQAKGEVRWLTTAASLWAAAALGYAAGTGQYLVAAVGTLLVLATLRWLPAIEELIRNPKGRDAAPPSDGDQRPD
jgi:putative Mg2+ transporter-C (MgtC) family protein